MRLRTLHLLQGRPILGDTPCGAVDRRWYYVLLVVTSNRSSDRRDQMNLSLGARSPLALRLHAAEAMSGKSRTRIAREVLEDYLDLWVAARRRQRAAVVKALRVLGR